MESLLLSSDDEATDGGTEPVVVGSTVDSRGESADESIDKANRRRGGQGLCVAAHENATGWTARSAGFRRSFLSWW